MELFSLAPVFSINWKLGRKFGGSYFFSLFLGWGRVEEIKKKK